MGNRAAPALQPQFIQVLRFLWSQLGTKKGIFVAGIVLNLAQAITMMLDPLFVSLVVGKLETGQYQLVPVLLVVFIVLIISLAGTALLSEYMKTNSMFYLNEHLMVQMADVAQKLPLASAQMQHSSDLVQRITHDTPRTTRILSFVFDNMADQLLMLILAAIYLLWVDWKVAIVVLTISPLMLLCSYALRKKLQQIGGDIAGQEAVIRKHQQDCLQNMEIIRVYGVGEWALRNFERERKKLNVLYMKRMWLYQYISLFSTTLSNLMIISTVLIIGYLYMDQSVALGSMVVYFTLIWRVNTPMNNIGGIWGQVQESLGSSSRMFSLLNAEQEPSIMSIDSSESRGGVTLRNVNFAYHADDTGHVSGQTGEQLLHLNDICLHIEQGAYVAVTGPSGSGKSTLGKIIAGLLFPAEGQIRVGGRNPLEDAANARSMVAYVPQVTALFTGSIRDNLVLGRTDISYETMVHAAKLAQLHEFIEQLPQGYDTDIKEQGASMSGGQKQRLAIARAVLADRPIWVLDEATSALDIDTEREVISAITKEARKRNRTIISIAHRMTSVQDADCIIVMDNGCIRQQGTHHDLLDGEDSLYRQLWGYKTA